MNNLERYIHLGDYIRQVDVSNRDLTVQNLLGLSISKQFIPSIANIIWTIWLTIRLYSYAMNLEKLVK